MDRLAQSPITLAIVLSLVLSCRGQSAPPPASASPVLVELFTSEGCSDCPPAERLLAQLDSAQPVPGVHAIVLEEHVTYWDRQGWRDPFSLDEVTDRQKQYQSRFSLDDVFTPQMVVDGTVQFVGNDGRALEAALTSAATTQKQSIAIENAHWRNGTAEFTVHSATPSGAKLIAILAADATQSQVLAGENAGKTLHHVAVVRVIREIKPEEANARPLKLSNSSLKGSARLVVFLVDHKTGHVLAVAEQNLTNAQ